MGKMALAAAVHYLQGRLVADDQFQKPVLIEVEGREAVREAVLIGSHIPHQ